MSCVKGTGVLAVYEFLSTIEGAQGLDKIKSALSEADKKIFSQKVMPISWVDFGFYMRMIVAADKVLGKGDFKIVEDAARYNMNKNFNSFYKFLISFTNPKFVMDRSNKVWRQWFDHGTLATHWESDKSGTLVLTDFPEMPVYHEYNLTPSIDEIIKISGGKNSKCIHEKCMLKGDQGCVWKISWE